MTTASQHSQVVDVTTIDKVPIAAILADQDVTCPFETSMKYIPTLGENVSIHIVPGEDHMYFQYAQSKQYVDMLISELQIPT